MSGTATPTPMPTQPEPRPGSDRYTLLVDEQLRRTRLQVRGVDIAAGLLGLAVGTLGFLLVATLADHWLLGGLGFWWRLLLLAGWCSAAGYFFFVRVLNPLLHRINPVFVAHTIEQSRPSLKNSLVNFLLLRTQRPDVAPAVYRAIERRAAADLADVSPEAVVDRRHVLRLATAFVVVVAIGGLYQVLSPKSPLTSVARIIWPWANIEAPTRVTLSRIRPGDTTAFHGQKVTVSAEVHGTRQDEPVVLYYTTADGQSVDQTVPMTLSKDGYRHGCKLPPGSFGLQQDLEYYLAAGDCTSRIFKISVETAPAILVDTIEYHYPRYTEIADRVVRNRGDIRAIEGTRIVIHAKANTAVGRAEIDLDCDGLRAVKMKAEGQKAVGQFALRMDPDDQTRPEHNSYQLRLTDSAGRENRRPIRHQIEVIADLPPEIHLVDPPKDHLELPEDGKLTLRIRAEDPDFALRHVSLRAQRGGKSLPIDPLLDKPAPEPPHQGRFEASCELEPARLGLKAGDQVVYFAEAKDNKTPVPGRRETRRRSITIVPPERQKPLQQQPDRPEDQRLQQQEQQQQQQDQEQAPAEDQPPEHEPSEQPQQQPPKDDSAKPESGEQQPGGQQPGEQGDQAKPEDADRQGESAGGQKGEQPSDKPSEPLDGQTNPGDVFEEILKHREKQQQQQKQPSREMPDQPQPDQKQPGEKQPGEEQPGKQQPGAQENDQQPGAQENDQQPGGESSETKKKPQDGQGGQVKDTAKRDRQSPSGGDAERGKGAAGEGSGGRDEGPTPSPQGENKPREKTPHAGQNRPGEDPEEKSPSTSRHESDSEGGQSGDRSGGGEPGGGQRTDRSGTGAAGANTEAEQGSSQAQQQGKGETGTEAGDQVAADRPTGRSDPRERPGPGSKTRQKPPEQPGSSSKRPGDPDQGGGAQPQGTTSEPANDRLGGNPTGGGAPSDRPEPEPPRQTGEPGGDDFNRQFAEKQTSLALETLQEQLVKEKPDQGLLDNLGGWTREDLEKFLQRWQEMKRAAGQQGPQGDSARRELDQALQSLGLRPARTELRSGTKSDQLPQVRQSRRIAPPPGWEEQIRAYKRGVAGGR